MSFKSEIKVLQEERDKELQRVEDEHIPLPGHDDTLSHLRRPIFNEYNKKLIELKSKYDVK